MADHHTLCPSGAAERAADYIYAVQDGVSPARPAHAPDRRSAPELGRWRRVVTARPAALGVLDRLAVDQAPRGARFSASMFAGMLDQDEIDPFPQPIRRPVL